jgi:hypothetical protein
MSSKRAKGKGKVGASSDDAELVALVARLERGDLESLLLSAARGESITKDVIAAKLPERLRTLKALTKVLDDTDKVRALFTAHWPGAHALPWRSWCPPGRFPRSTMTPRSPS